MGSFCDQANGHGRKHTVVVGVVVVVELELEHSHNVVRGHKTDVNFFGVEEHPRIIM